MRRPPKSALAAAAVIKCLIAVSSAPHCFTVANFSRNTVAPSYSVRSVVPSARTIRRTSLRDSLANFTSPTFGEAEPSAYSNRRITSLFVKPQSHAKFLTSRFA